jgi:hypothetical protein
MPKTKPASLKKADASRYLLCPTCSDEEGEEVYYHQRAVKSTTPFLADQAVRTCPEGHELPEPEGGE